MAVGDLLKVDKMHDDGPRRITSPASTVPRWLLPAGLVVALTVVGVVYGPAVKAGLVTAAVANFRPHDPSVAFKSYFTDCQEAHQAGVYSIPRGAPQYRAALDADDNGLACEPDGR